MKPKSLNPIDISRLLERYGLRPHKGLGQNFLQDEGALRTIVAAAKLDAKDPVLEIGPGLGSLTRHLAIEARQVTAVELDQALIPALQAVLAEYSNVRIVQGDILKIKPAELVDLPGYIVVANIPYYITSAVIRHLLENPPKPRRVVLTVQKEVAERVCALDGKMSLLSLSVQVYGKPVIAGKIAAESFYPAPKVDSAVLVVEITPQPAIPTERLETFFRLARAGFSQKRKTLRNSLSAGMHLSTEEGEALLTEAGIDPQRRAETLKMDEWGILSEKWEQKGENKKPV